VASKSLLVHYGLKNEGAEAISRRLRGQRFRFPVGISVAKTNSPDTVEESRGIADYVKAYAAFAGEGIGDYFTINVSCPNTFGGEPFTEPAKLDRLLSALGAVPSEKPVFIKLPAELDLATVDAVIALARKHRLAGFVCSNLAKSRANPRVKDRDVPDRGGMSGLVVRDLSDAQIAHVYRATRGEFAIVGCGGVFTAEDAYRKVRLGASLIQMITGLIYEGPQVVREVNEGLVRLLRRDGLAAIGDAVGLDADLGAAAPMNMPKADAVHAC
jgi:dihydroorotate dehydrogenase